jgi:hypothetical protein
VLACGKESYPISDADVKELFASETEFVRRPADNTVLVLHHKRNKYISEKLIINQ